MDFMQEFRPRPETVQLQEAFGIQLGQLDQRIKTLNNPGVKQVVEHLLASMLVFNQWVVSHNNDFIDYMHAVTSRVEGGGLDDDEFAVLSAVHSHLEEIQKLFEEMKELLPPNVLALGERNKELMAALGDILEVESGDEEAPLFADDEEAAPEEEVAP